ncbi:MAG: type 1 glutamine amidotransferase [Nocardioides sp.]|uniref:type 1 glutamine amidotransferase n=1 Tax=Nocardioides sp. TaxID=35761 RepID=UPI0039E31020
MRALVITHDHVSPIGAIGERLEHHGYALETHNVVSEENHHTPWVASVFPSFADVDLVVTMGAPWSTYDEATVGAWVPAELDQLRAADDAGVPVLGICFGGQLLATAHGGSVARAPRPEIGWSEIESDADHLVPAGPWFQWHFDRWTTPEAATEVARNEYASQAFTLRRNLAVQFHPELNGAMLIGWLAAGGEPALIEAGHDVAELVSATHALDARSRSRAHALVDGFLAHVATADAPTDGARISA